jgi:hypothetical protein
MKYILLLVILYACQNSYNDNTIVDSELQQYIIMFEKDSGLKVESSVTFAAPHFFEGSQAAITLLSASTAYRSPIYVNTQIWPTLSKEQKILLLYHELVHSVIGLGHQDGYSDDCPLNLMNYAIASPDCATALLQRYRAELTTLVQLRQTKHDIYHTYLLK